jgi:hypothetical protein
MTDWLRKLLALIVFVLLVLLLLDACEYSHDLAPIPVPYFSASSWS